jgi:lysophospholipase L1-like esterase
VRLRTVSGLPFALDPGVKRLAIALLPWLLLTGCQSRQESAQRESHPVTETQRMPQDLHIVALGDSLAYGAGDERGGGITSRLRHELQARGVASVETVNLGANGARTDDLIRKLQQQSVRQQVAAADAIILSVGANDLFRSPHSREEVMRSPFTVAERILGRIAEVVAAIHQLNPDARILLLGGYNPVPRHEWAAAINRYLLLWDEALAARFEDDSRITIVRMADIVVPDRLSSLDSFHPGGEAYDAAARRIATMLLDAA